MNAVDIIRYFESKYPTDLAYEWDNCGLQIGTLNLKTKKVLITLDVTKEVVKEAIREKVQLIISHHPLMFKPMQTIVFDSPRGWIVKNLIQHNIAVYSAHTNFDVADGGMNDILATKLGLRDIALLDEENNIGRFGQIKPMPMADFIAFFKKTFNLDHIKVIGKIDKTIRTVAISGGSGSHHMYAAKRKNCDVYITGDVTYHTALDAEQLGQTMIDAGHHIEVVFVSSVHQDLSQTFTDLEFIKSAVNTNPYISS